MPKPLSPTIRRQIIQFDPHSPGAVSITEFCTALGITRASFYNIRRRYAAVGNKALNPRSSAPKNPRRTYTDDTVEAILQIRARLKEQGWDHGPESIWFAGVDQGVLTAPVPSVSTIARILSSTGSVDANPRKRPRSSLIRFARSYAMELWQLDAFEYRLADDTGEVGPTVVTVYQLIDDATRFDVGTAAYAAPENGVDARSCLDAAFVAHGIPQQLLTDNGNAFNSSRQGWIAETERFVADRGCLPISGSVSHPQTQGKNERSHKTLQNFLDANRPTTLTGVRALIDTYREYYNHRRHHQGLPGKTTPAQAWDAAEHRPSDGTPVGHAELESRAQRYRDRQAAKVAARPTDRPDDVGIVHGPVRAPGGRVITDSGSSDQLVITRENRVFSIQGRVLSVPAHLVGSYYEHVTDEAYRLFSAVDGREAVRFPLPLRTAETRRRFPLWKVVGAWIRDAPPAWMDKHRGYLEEFFPSGDPGR